jgi:hypothetical protein
MENILAHTFGMLFAVAIFSVYTLGRNGIQSDWVQIAGTLVVFGIVYELLSWLFFNLFQYFATTRQKEGEVVTVQAGEPTDALE